MARLKLLVSLHDVTPVHAARLAQAEALLHALAIQEVTYLFVPRFHGVPAENDAAFVRWCQARRPFRVHWMLHGYLHQERPASSSVAAAIAAPRGAWWKRRLLTGGEGEFLALHGDALHERLLQGCGIFRRCLDADPNGFVPPAWLAHPELRPALRGLGFDYTEDHHRLYQLQHDRSQRAPVITWATRTVTRRVGSRVVCPLMRTLWQSQPVLRVALHPHDFDYPATIASITRLLRALVREREVIDVHGAFMSPVLP
jgi:predicted deacetylase